MTLDFKVTFLIDRTGDLELKIVDNTDYTGVSTAYGFYKIEYPDGVIVENTDVNNPDFTISSDTFIKSLRTTKGKLIYGQYTITQKVFSNTGDDQLVKSFTFNIGEPSLVLEDNSNLITPTVSFLDSTNYNANNYTIFLKDNTISCEWPSTTGLTGTLDTTTNELFMVDSGNYYEGLYKPTLLVHIIYTGTGHDVDWKISQDFEFDIRKFLEHAGLVDLMDNLKDKLDKSPNDYLRDQYQMLVSLYSHIIGKISVGDTEGIEELIIEMQRIAISCSCKCNPEQPYVYSSDPLPAFEADLLLRFPYIDEVIYREWNETITFKSTSTIFFRVDGEIRWFKSKQNDNLNNPVYIDGELNDTWWEPIGGSGSDNCSLRTKFTYTSGPQTFELPFVPQGIWALYINGVLQDDETYSLSDNIVTILPTTTLSSGAKIAIWSNLCDVRLVEAPNIIKEEEFEYDDSNTFTLSFTPQYIHQVFVNGQFQRKVYYSINGNDVVFVSGLEFTDSVTNIITIFYAVDKTSFLEEAEQVFAPLSGTTANRPTSVAIGKEYFDTDLGFPVWWNGTEWVNLNGDISVNGKMVWNTVTENTLANKNEGYITDSASRVVIDISTDNERFVNRITGLGLGGWQINVPNGGEIRFAGETVTDNLQSNDPSDSVEIICIGNLVYQVISSIGNITFNNM